MNKKNKDIPIIEIKNSKKPQSLVFQTAARAALLCLAAVGACLVFANTYGIPVSTFETVIFCVLSTLILIVFFILLKFRFALPLLIAAGWLFLKGDEMSLYFKHFFNYFSYRLDSRLLYTSIFATLKQHQIEISYVIKATFFIFFIICFLYAISSRAKFVGTVLITVIVLLIPAFISETAVFNNGYYPLMCAMVGLYVIWISHESGFFVPPKRKSAVMGGAPYINSNGFQGLTAALICAVCLAVGNFIAGGENSTANKFIYRLQQDLMKTIENLPELLNYGNNIDHNGYFTISGSNEFSSYIHLNAPTTSNRPVLSVKKSDNTEPLYLRGSICLDYNSRANGWTTANRTDTLKELNKLIENYYPETEYMLFAQRFMVGKPIGDSYYSEYHNFIDVQDVYLEYLLNTKVVLTPPAGVYPEYKQKDTINYSLDTVLRSKRTMQFDSFSTYYIKKSTPGFGFAWENLNLLIKDEYAYGDNKSLVTEYPGYLAYTPLDKLNMTPSEYLEKKIRYEELVKEIYLSVPDSESENIERLKIEMRRLYARNEYVFSEMAAEYFRNNYEYSLTVDNLNGNNTMLGNFLFETRQGHCALYATAMTLFLRSEGIPARYVTGYVVNGEGTPIPGNLYQYTVVERDLHAWVEVYFKNLGWVAFDPTPPITESVFIEAEGGVTTPPMTNPPEETSDFSDTMPGETTTSPEDHNSENPSQSETQSDAGIFNINSIITVLIIAFILLTITILTLYTVFLLKREKKILKMFSRSPAPASLKGACVKTSDFIATLWKAEGLMPSHSELPLDFAARIDDKIKLLNLPLAEEVTGIIEKLEFSRESLTEKEYKVLSEYAAGLYTHTVLSQKPLKRMLRRMMVLTAGARKPG